MAPLLESNMDQAAPIATATATTNTPTTTVGPIKDAHRLVVRSSYENQGTVMDIDQRSRWGVNALSPSRVETLAIQKRRAMRQFRSKASLLEKYIFMAQMRTTHTHLFYKIVIEELEELAPVIYTPTVGTACLEYSNIYPFLAAPGVSDGLYLTYPTSTTATTTPSRNDIVTMIQQYQPFPNEVYQPEIAVISDGSRILGLGDLGVNGIGIPIGKLQLYVAGAGIDPRKTLPIILDLGTNNEKFLQDEFYLGLRQRRPADPQFYEAVDQVIQSIHQIYPDILIQFEDWSSEHAFGLLEKYQQKMLCFNDDIQGTGAVILSGVINAIRRVQKESGVRPQDHRVVFYGAGSAAIGVARQIQEYFQIEHGLTEEQAKHVFWIVDSKGLVTSDRGDNLAQHKVYYARTDNQGQQYKSLMDIIEYVKPTCLIGLSSIPGAFTTEVLHRLGQLNEQPIVFPLSNPATQAECNFEQAMQATDQRVIFASGTAFPAFVDPATGKKCVPGQGNNMYIFPGLGLGAVLAKPRYISDRMIYAASKALADALDQDELNQGWLYPSLTRIRHVSAIVAAAVCREAKAEGLVPTTQNTDLPDQPDALLSYVINHMWTPSSLDAPVPSSRI